MPSALSQLKSHPDIELLTGADETMEDFLLYTEQNILQRWVNFHLAKQKKSISNFRLDFRNSTQFALLLQELFPDEFGNLVSKVKAKKDILERAKLLIKSLSTKVSSHGLKPEELASASAPKKTIEALAKLYLFKSGLEAERTRRAQVKAKMAEMEAEMNQIAGDATALEGKLSTVNNDLQVIQTSNTALVSNLVALENILDETPDAENVLPPGFRDMEPAPRMNGLSTKAVAHVEKLKAELEVAKQEYNAAKAKIESEGSSLSSQQQELADQLAVSTADFTALDSCMDKILADLDPSQDESKMLSKAEKEFSKELKKMKAKHIDKAALIRAVKAAALALHRLSSLESTLESTRNEQEARIAELKQNTQNQSKENQNLTKKLEKFAAQTEGLTTAMNDANQKLMQAMANRAYFESQLTQTIALLQGNENDLIFPSQKQIMYAWNAVLEKDLYYDEDSKVALSAALAKIVKDQVSRDGSKPVSKTQLVAAITPIVESLVPETADPDVILEQLIQVLDDISIAEATQRALEASCIAVLDRFIDDDTDEKMRLTEAISIIISQYGPGKSTSDDLKRHLREAILQLAPAELDAIELVQAVEEVIEHLVPEEIDRGGLNEALTAVLKNVQGIDEDIEARLLWELAAVINALPPGMSDNATISRVIQELIDRVILEDDNPELHAAVTAALQEAVNRHVRTNNNQRKMGVGFGLGGKIKKRLKDLESKLQVVRDEISALQAAIDQIESRLEALRILRDEALADAEKRKRMAGDIDARQRELDDMKAKIEAEIKRLQDEKNRYKHMNDAERAKLLSEIKNQLSNPEKSGWCHLKKGRGWKKRWFVLKGDYLVWFQKADNAKPLGLIFVDEERVFPLDKKGSGGKSNAFKIKTPSDEYLLYCDRPAETSDWIRQLKKSKQILLESRNLDQFRGLKKSK